MLPFCEEQSRLGKEVDRIGESSCVVEFAVFRANQPFFFFRCDAKHLHVLVINNFCLEKILESCYASNNRMTL